jgi:NADPH-dependent 2,4-dienoyl-CoA reductase/sulfur reductase-like enzyme
VAPRDHRKRTQFRTKGTGAPIGWTVNAAVGREEEMEIVPIERARSVLVVGGGPADMEAARVAPLRGHQVVLCERYDTLGGQVPTAALAPGAGDLMGGPLPARPTGVQAPCVRRARPRG